MQFALFYMFIYLLIVTVFTLSVRKIYMNKSGLTDFSYPSSGSQGMLILFLILFIGLRPEHSIFGDMMMYVIDYNLLYKGVPFVMDWQAENVIFDNLIALSGSFQIGLTPFFTLCAIVYFGCSYLGIKRLFPNHTYPVYLVYLAAFSTFSYATNGVKAGCAASLFIWALSYCNNMKVCLPLMVLAVGFHHSMKVPILAFLLTRFFNKSSYYFYGWALCLLMAALHVNFFQNLFAGYADKGAQGYLMSDGSDNIVYAKGGFRLDFILYSAMPVWAGYLLIMKRQIEVSKTYKTLLHYYMTTNGAWMLCMYAEFTNRIAYLSWFLYPIVLVYPFLNEEWGVNKYLMFAKVMLWHLGFTVFMEMIYYGGFMRLFG